MLATVLRACQVPGLATAVVASCQLLLVAFCQWPPVDCKQKHIFPALFTLLQNSNRCILLALEKNW
jgi:hypothetical protein